MSQFGRKLSHSPTLRRRFHHRVSLLRRCVLRFLHRVLLCSGSKANATYSILPPALPSPPPPPPGSDGEPTREEVQVKSPSLFHADDLDSDLVSLKISLLGDCQIGKTSFLVKYVGNEKEQQENKREGLNQMDKTLAVKGARISYCIWEVEGDGKSENQIPMACVDSVAILIMFDLTSRVTLNRMVQRSQEMESDGNSSVDRNQV